MQLSYKLFQHQIAGRIPKLVNNDETKILKKFDSKQHFFYSFINSLSITDPLQSLVKFLPKYYGQISLEKPLETYLVSEQSHCDPHYKEWVGHIMKRFHKVNSERRFLVIENVISKFEYPNVLDIKLGNRDPKLSPSSRWDRRKSYLIHGFKIHCSSGKPIDNSQSSQNYDSIFLSKYSFVDVIKRNEDFIEHLGLFFTDGHTLRVNLLNKVIQKLRELILCMKSLHSWKLYSSSVCIFYDAKNDGNFAVKFIDFGKSYHTASYQVEDDSLVVGLENLHQDLMKVLELGELLNNRYLQLKEKYLTEQIVIVPEDKKKQYDKQQMIFMDNSRSTVE